MGFLGKLVWLFTIIGSVNWGLDALGWNLFSLVPLVNMPRVILIVKYVVGVSGVISLFMLIQELMNPCGTCK